MNLISAVFQKVYAGNKLKNVFSTSVIEWISFLHVDGMEET